MKRKKKTSENLNKKCGEQIPDLGEKTNGILASSMCDHHQNLALDALKVRVGKAAICNFNMNIHQFLSQSHVNTCE